MRQYDWFAPNTAPGLTQTGLSRINQSIEAFVYCVLGAQVNVRSSILGVGDRAKEAQSEFLVLMEDAIRQPDLSQSVQRYQLAVDQAKVRLNLTVCVADARENDHQHRKHDRLPQQAETGRRGNETGGKQRGKPGDKKSRAQTHGRRSIKNQPAQQSSVQPHSQSSHGRPNRQAAARKTTKRGAHGRLDQASQCPNNGTNGRHEPTRNQQNSCDIRGRGARGVDLDRLALAPLFDIFLKQKGHCCKNQQPGVLGEIADHLPRGFEKEARDLADQPGEHGPQLRAYFFEAGSQSSAGGFQSISS